MYAAYATPLKSASLCLIVTIIFPIGSCCNCHSIPGHWLSTRLVRIQNILYRWRCTHTANLTLLHSWIQVSRDNDILIYQTASVSISLLIIQGSQINLACFYQKLQQEQHVLDPEMSPLTFS